jgi:hypothetical protein
MIETMPYSYRAQIELLEEALAIERSKRKMAERVLRQIADLSTNSTVRRLAVEYLEAA